MENLLVKSAFLTEEVPTHHIRSLYQKVDWSDRLIGITGARGTGKTTLLLQYLKLSDQLPGKALYVSLDDIYFATHDLLELAETFRKRGGKLLLLDEVHKYQGWARIIKNLYDTYKDLSIVFTGSSVIDIYTQEADLSRRAIFYELSGLSFREYLLFSNVYESEILTLDTILNDHTQIALKLAKGFKPLEHFENYLKYGYYPFFTENIKTYSLRIEQIIRLIVETELRFIDGFDISNTGKVLQLLAILSENVPFKPNISKLSEKIGISRATILQYLHYLSKARLINILAADGKSISILQKPEKIYLENPNLHYTLSPERSNKGSEREAFFLNQLKNAGHNLSIANKGDFFVDNKYYFEVGGKNKNRSQIGNLPNAFLAVDDIEIGFDIKIPLWMFGFLY